MSALLRSKNYPPPCVMGDEEIMSKKAHGTSAVPVQDNLRWGCDKETADRICNFNRHYAEHSGYFQKKSAFLEEVEAATGEMTFYDSNTGKPLFHPNVYPSGKICLSLLDAEKSWKPSLTIKHLLIGIQTLLDDPNNADPAQEEPYKAYKSDRKEYEARVKQQVALLKNN